MENTAIEKELEEFLGIRTDDLKDTIIGTAVWIKKDTSRMVVLRIFPDGTYDVGIGQKGNYDGYDGNERFWYEFSIIEPWDLPDYESVRLNDDYTYTDTETGYEYESEDELLGKVETSVFSGFYHKFEEEWRNFLREFCKWRH